MAELLGRYGLGDLVLSADAIYRADLLEPFLRALDAVVGEELLIAHKKRHRDLDDRLEEALRVQRQDPAGPQAGALAQGAGQSVQSGSGASRGVNRVQSDALDRLREYGMPVDDEDVQPKDSRWPDRAVNPRLLVQGDHFTFRTKTGPRKYKLRVGSWVAPMDERRFTMRDLVKEQLKNLSLIHI